MVGFPVISITSQSHPESSPREDLLSSSMMALPPHFARVYCNVFHRDIHFPNPIAGLIPDLGGEAYHPCVEMTKIFENIRYLTHCLNDQGNLSTRDVNFSAMSSALVRHLLRLKTRKTAAGMTLMDYQLEAVRLGALMYLDSLCVDRHPLSWVTESSKSQLISVISEGESQGLGDVELHLRRGLLTWALWIGGLLSLNEEEETFFAKRVAISIKAWHREEMATWKRFEAYLRRVSWSDNLKTSRCMSLWDRVQRMCEDEAAQKAWPSFPIDFCVPS